MIYIALLYIFDLQLFIADLTMEHWEFAKQFSATNRLRERCALVFASFFSEAFFTMCFSLRNFFEL